MCAFDSLHIKIESPRARMGADGGIARICQRTGLSVAKTSHIVLIAAEILQLRGPVTTQLRSNNAASFRLAYLSLKEQNC